jgi:hypothetical protein
MIKHRPVPGVVTDPRSWGLFAVALIYFSRGWAYTFTNALDPLPYGLDVLVQYVSIKAYGVLWFIGAVIGFWMALWRVRRVWGAALMTAMPTLWALAYLLSWVIVRDIWTPVFVYGCLSVIVVSFGILPPQKVVFARDRRGRGGV